MKKEKRIGLISLIGLILLCSAVFAADITPTTTTQDSVSSHTWLLESGRTTSGDSNTAVNVQYCRGAKTLELKSIIVASGGSVNISFKLKEGANAVTTKTITSTTAETVMYSTDHNIDRLSVTSTITAGAVASITLRCN